MFTNMNYVYAVYQHKGFMKAAESLYISQPALSLTIKKIETRLGTQLFDRSTNPIRLTESGEEYIRCAEKIMDIENGFQNYLSDLNDLASGTLSIGASNFFASYILPPIITKYKKKYPLVTISLVESDTANLEKQLFSGGLDLIVDNYSFSETIYKKHFFYSERIILAVPAQLVTDTLRPFALTTEDVLAGRHLDTKTKAAPLSLFKDIPFILLRQGNDTRVRADKILTAAEERPEVILELDQLATAFHIAYKGLGATFTSDTLVRELQPDERMLCFKLDGSYADRENYFYYRHNKYLTRAMQEFLALARKSAPDLQ